MNPNESFLNRCQVVSEEVDKILNQVLQKDRKRSIFFAELILQLKMRIGYVSQSDQEIARLYVQQHLEYASVKGKYGGIMLGSTIQAERAAKQNRSVA